jgi:hypothetical protein
MNPSISGMSTRPALVAEVPITTCTKRGKNDNTPNIVMPSSVVSTAEARSAGTRNSPSGSSGSAARSSATMNATSRITLPASAPTIVGDDHA